MEPFLIRFKKELVLIAVLLAQTVGLAVQVRRPTVSSTPDGRQVYLLRAWVNGAATPVERLGQRAAAGLRGVWTNYLDLRRVRGENRDLRQQIASMRLETAAFAQDALQGQRLQALLTFQQHYVVRTLAAQVIGTSGSDMSRVVMIDKGADFKLKPEMAVITPDGVAGKLRDVFAHTAQLQLLNDPSSGSGVLLQSTRIRAIARGTPTGRLQIGNLTADARIKVGETVLSSGGDLVYPRGLPVGTIESIAPDPEHQPYTAITVKPAVNLAQLDEVLVIIELQTELPAEARQDLAQGVATAEQIKAQAEESKRAADLLAERLPSLQAADPSQAGAQGSPLAAEGTDAAKAPGGTVPKPLPTLHADHFSPGSALPAAELTPGARSVQTPVSGEGAPMAVAPPVRMPRKPLPAEPTPEQLPLAPVVPGAESTKPDASREPPR